jgi:hypothetical protein
VLNYLNRKLFISIIYSVIISSFIALTFHILFINQASPIINEALNKVTIIKPPYPFYINAIAYITTFIPALATTLLYIAIFPIIKSRTYISRSFILGTFVLMIKGELMRQPLMNILVGNPYSIALFQQSQVWITNYIMAFIIVFIIKKSEANAID